MAETFDVAIIGGGIAGISLAYFLARHRSVVVLERESALGYHSTGRSAAEFTHRFHSPVVAKLSAISYEFLIDPPAGFAETELLKRRGNVLIANEEKRDRLAQVFAEESAAGPGLERLTLEQALARAPILNPDYVVDAFYDPDCWDIEVESLLQGFARGARSADAKIVTKAELLAARRDGDCWRLETAAGDFRATTIVNASGGWADTTAALFGVEKLGLTPHRRTAITVDAPGVDVAALPEINEIDEQFYIKPDAGRLMVSPADQTPCEPYDAQPEEIDVAYAAWYLEQATTVAVKSVAHSWAGLRTFSPDRAPVVGFSGKAQGFFWLAGQGGYGILSSPAMGRFAAGQLLGDSPSPDFVDHGLLPVHLSPARFEK